MRIERAAARIETIMRSFPSTEATIKRPTMDDYGSATGATTNVGTVQCWCTGVNRPGKYIINNHGQTGDDEGGRWFAIIRTDETPAVKRGDYLCIGDERFIIRAIVPDGVSRREFWHCEVENMAVMTNGCWVDGSLFEAASEKLKRNCTVNVSRYAHMVGQAFVNTTRAQSVWINRRGVARRGFYFKVDGRTRNVITVEMGGKAPNYKKGKHSADDYMEFLEFDFDKRYAIIYPVHEAMMASIRSDLPDVVVKGKTQAPKIAHSKLANYKRTQRARGKYGHKSGIRGRRYL